MLCRFVAPLLSCYRRISYICACHLAVCTYVHCTVQYIIKGSYINSPVLVLYIFTIKTILLCWQKYRSPLSTKLFFLNFNNFLWELNYFCPLFCLGHLASSPHHPHTDTYSVLQCDITSARYTSMWHNFSAP